MEEEAKTQSRDNQCRLEFKPTTIAFLETMVQQELDDSMSSDSLALFYFLIFPEKSSS